jgi:hypothetical protein
VQPGAAFEEDLALVELDGNRPSLLGFGDNRRENCGLGRDLVGYLSAFLVGRPICEGCEIDDLPTVFGDALLGKLLQFLPIIAASHRLVPHTNGIIGASDPVPLKVLSQLSVAPGFQCADLHPTQCVHGERPHEGILHPETSVEAGTLQAQEDAQVHRHPLRVTRPALETLVVLLMIFARACETGQKLRLR